MACPELCTHGKELRHLVESGGSPVAGPRILPDILDHAGPHGIEHDVPAQFKKVRLPVHNDGLKPPLQHMPYPPMPPVEGLRVDAVQLAHGFGQIGVRRFEEQVEVIGHQTVGMTKHIEPAQRLPKDGLERIPVDVIGNDGDLGVAAGCHVIDGSREFYAKRSGHEGGGNMRENKIQNLTLDLLSSPCVSLWGR